MSSKITPEHITEFQAKELSADFQHVSNTRPTASLSALESWRRNGNEYAVPKATETETVEELKAKGFVGHYKREVAPANI